MEKQPELFKHRSPLLIMIFAIFTLGIYMLFWYEKIYIELQRITGNTPTGNMFLIDLLLALFTLGVWAIYMDYRISETLKSLDKQNTVNDTRLLVVILDIAAYFTVAFTFLLSSAIQQDQMNRLNEQHDIH